jgi:ATP-dependent Clp protease protease subunit
MPVHKPAIPVVIDRQDGEHAVDLFSRLMQDRLVFLNGPISTEMSHVVIAQLLYLDNEAPGKDIQMYINSPGGEISAGMAIYDAMKMIRSHVITICSGMAASMAAFLLAAGDRRQALPNAEMMIHQPSGGVQGVATEVEIEARRIIRMRKRMNELLAQMTGQPLQRIQEDSDRDFWMTPEEAKAYGLIDEILPPAKK